ncbi:hypothetical protein EMCRGX_G023102 [Ephydatia muelleri]
MHEAEEAEKKFKKQSKKGVEKGKGKKGNEKGKGKKGDEKGKGKKGDEKGKGKKGDEKGKGKKADEKGKGLHIQHLLDVAEVPVPTSICSLLQGVINILPSGQAPAAISQYMPTPFPVGTLTSEAGVQQGDPLGPLTIAKDNSCQDLLINACCLDDGVVAGPPSSVQHVVHLLQGLGPSLGLHLKCEHFSRGDLSLFPAEMNKSFTPNLAILGAPIGDVAFCSSFIASKSAAASILLSSL